jgi:hypothetical protein
MLIGLSLLVIHSRGKDVAKPLQEDIQRLVRDSSAVTDGCI